MEKSGWNDFAVKAHYFLKLFGKCSQKPKTFPISKIQKFGVVLLINQSNETFQEDVMIQHCSGVKRQPF